MTQDDSWELNPERLDSADAEQSGPRSVHEPDDADADEAASGSPSWRIHDKTHLELLLAYPEVDQRYSWEAYFFIPQSFRLNPVTYTPRRIYSDLASYVRRAVEPMNFRELGDVALKRLERRLSTADTDAAVQALRMFACRVRRAERRAFGKLEPLLDDGAQPPRKEILELVADADQLVTRWRELLDRAQPQLNEERLEVVARWVDEDISLVVESLLGRVVEALRRMGGADDLSDQVATRAVDEARYRLDVGYQSVVNGDVDKREVERLEFRRHTLKRFTAAVLWLPVEMSEPGTWAKHALYALAAGVAMAFAVTAALWNGPEAMKGDLAFWGLVAVVAYAIKDRMKASLQEVFNKLLSRRFPDRRWRVSDKEEGVELGLVDEESGFVDFDKLPAGVLEARDMTRRHPLEQEARPECVLRHEKTITVRDDPRAPADEPHPGLVEVFRLNVGRWLAHTDDPKTRIVIANPESGDIDAVTAPRVYNVGVVYRLRKLGDDNVAWRRSRVVVSRKGIERIDHIS
jgi:hypothetical protein